MKKIATLLLVVLGMTTVFGQDKDRPENTGDNFSLEGALELFKKSNSIEEFEQLLNNENNNVNNLDLNNDGNTDYIMVDDIQDGTTHAIVLSTYLNENEKQDIATIGIEKNGDQSAILQIEGDTDLYAANTIVEPSDANETLTRGKGPDAGELIVTPIVVNVWLWPSVRFIYGPRYVVWHSPWHWNVYPRWWRPWRPYSYTVFYRRWPANYRAYYRRVPTRTVIVAHNVYAPRRRSSTLILQNRRGATVVRENGRGNVRAVRMRGGGRGRRR